VNALTNTHITDIQIGPYTEGVCVSPDGSKVYCGSFSNYVKTISTATNTVIDSVAVGNTPYGIGITKDGSKLYVACESTNDVTVINTSTNTVITSVPVGTQPFAFGLFIWNGGMVNTATSSEFLNKAIDLYPNPVTNVLNINTPFDQFDYAIYNTLGEQLIAGQSMQSMFKLSCSNFPAGNYFLILTHAEKSIEIKFVKD
jgi:YVTN family beta-propeller protein